MKLINVVDTLGRLIIGEPGTEWPEADVTPIKNPVVVNIAPTQNGQMSVQLIPYVFKELLKGGADVTVNFKNAGLNTLAGAEVDDRLVEQYRRMFSSIITPGPGVMPGKPPGGKVVNLFDK